MKFKIFLFLSLVIFSKLKAQEKKTVIEFKDKQTNSAISYYSISDGENWIIGDSMGRVTMTSQFFNKPLKVHCLSYPDTTIIINDNVDYKLIVLHSTNVLDEVIIKPSYIVEKKIRKIESNEKLFNSVGYVYTSKMYGRSIEYGQVFDFESLIFLRTASIKARTNYPPEKLSILLHIYQFAEPSTTIPVMINVLNKIKPIIKDGFLIFDLSKEKIYLNRGKYIISFEILPTKNTSEKVYIPFNLGKENPAKQNTINKAGVRSWINATHDGRFAQLVTTVEYQNVIK